MTSSPFQPSSTREASSATEQFYIEQFYYREARLLDSRCYTQWLGLLDEDIEYLMPSRHVPQPDPAARGTEDFLAEDRELERRGPAASPLRQENLFQLSIRANRPYKLNAWAESPPPRTRRFINNVEVEILSSVEYRVYSNFQLFYSHHGRDNHTYTGCRRDVLRVTEGALKILSREVIMDWDVITAPTLGLFF